MLNITYSHLCEKAFLSQNGNLNVIGIFEKIAAPQFPMSFPQLSIVTSLQGKPGEHKITIKIVRKKDNKEMTNAIILNINIKAPKEGTQDQIQNLRIIGDINNLVIDETGDYEVQVFTEDKQAYSIPFSVHKATKPIPEGR
jgi:hypothetical protein